MNDIPLKKPVGPNKPRSHAILKHFRYEHLPEHLQEISKPVCELARHMIDTLPEDPEKSAGLRKLLEAKDCFVRTSTPD